MLELLSVEDKRWLQNLKIIVIGWTLMLSLYKTYKCRVYKWYVRMNVRQYQYDIANDLRPIIPPKTCLYAVDNDLQFLYLVLETLPPNLSSIGFSFGKLGVSEQMQMKQIESADFVVFHSGDIDDEKSIVYKMADYLNNYQSYSVGEEGWFLVYDMKQLKQQ